MSQPQKWNLALIFPGPAQLFARVLRLMIINFAQLRQYPVCVCVVSANIILLPINHSTYMRIQKHCGLFNSPTDASCVKSNSF